MERKKYKRNLGTLLFGLGAVGILFGIHEVPRGNEDPNKKVWEETYPAKPWEVIGASAMLSVVGLGFLASYKEDREDEEMNEYFGEQDLNEYPVDSVSYYNLE